MDHNENCCIFDASQYTGTPDTAPCARTIDTPEIIRALDRLYEKGRENSAEEYLEHWRSEAEAIGDWRGRLSMVNELLGQYRRSSNVRAGLDSVNEALELIRDHRLGRTVSGATIMLNAATTLKCFGRAEESLPIFRHAARVYADKLDPGDYRFAGLYNNMALSYADVGDYASAERCFELAMKTVSGCTHPENDMAVTCCNMAEMYAKTDPGDPRIERYIERAWELLNAPDLPWDGYHAFTVSKCAPSFDYFGYFLYAMELRDREKKIYEGT